MLKHRLLYGAVLVAALAALIYADHRLSGLGLTLPLPEQPVGLGPVTCHGAIVTALVMGLVILGTRELRSLLAAAGHAPLLVWPAVVNVGLILIAFHGGNGPPSDAAEHNTTDYPATVVWLTVAVLGTAYLVARRRRIDHAVADIATTLFMILYLGLLPQYIIRLRLIERPGAAWLLVYFLATVKVCDITAYFAGIAVGRHKLIAWLSPGKTIEGLAGGLAGSILVGVLLPVVVERLAPASSPVHGLLPGVWQGCVFGLLMGVSGQAGDLLESLIKRDARAKDSAGAIPAFGGVLDILDSPLVAAPIAYWMLIQ